MQPSPEKQDYPGHENPIHASLRINRSPTRPGQPAAPRAGRTHSISAENPTGRKARAAWQSPIRPSPSQRRAPGRRITLATAGSPAVHQAERAPDGGRDGRGWPGHHPAHLDGRRTESRPGNSILLDGEETPSVESPVPDFFAVGHGKFAQVNSLPVVVNPANALNCFWPMPFRKHARITLSNETGQDVELVAYQITYAETDVPRRPALSMRNIGGHRRPNATLCDPRWS